MSNTRNRSISAPVPHMHAIHSKRSRSSTLCDPDAPSLCPTARRDYAIEEETHTLCGYGVCQQDVFYPQGEIHLVMSRPKKPSRRSPPRTPPSTAPPSWKSPSVSTPHKTPKDLRLFRGNDGTRHDEWVAAYLARLFAPVQPPIQSTPLLSRGHASLPFSLTHSSSRSEIRIDQCLTTVS
ncbi:hypothetical protein BD779DRAFT_1670815 [Infundibulicybe gibba]|nr:hypothetical protein BD779DRAFT_1670815 [Infundibulicybe gibba]